MMFRKIRRKILSLFSIERSLSDYEWLAARGVDTQPGYVKLVGKPIINIVPGAKVKMGKGVIVVSDISYNEAGINHPVMISAISPNSEIIIEDGVGMCGTSIVAVSKVVIGKDTQLGVNTNIWDTDFHSTSYVIRKNQKSVADAPSAPILIGEHCWIAANSTILKGVTIGENVTIGAMSLVNKSLPDNVLVGGVPAKILREN